jgi:hypothetical protein
MSGEVTAAGAWSASIVKNTFPEGALTAATEETEAALSFELWREPTAWPE